MKLLCILLAALLPILGRAEQIPLADGRTVEGTILRAEPDGLVVETADGIVKILFTRLPEADRARYGMDEEKAAQFRAAAQAAAARRAQEADYWRTQQQRQETAGGGLRENERQLRVERSGLRTSGTILQTTDEGARVELAAATGAAAASALDRDTRGSVALGEGFVYGARGAEGESVSGVLYPAGYYTYTTVRGAERTIRAYVRTVTEAMKRGAGAEPAVR